MSAAGATNDHAPRMTLIHSTKISAVHRLWSTALSEDQNLATYGQATHTHGHEYTFHITFEGPVCKHTGQLIAGELLEDVVGLGIVEVLDRKDLDDIPFFLSRPSTLENVCLFVWRNMAVIMKPHPYKVIEVEVELPGCWRRPESRLVTGTKARYRGEMCPVLTNGSVNSSYQQ